MATEWITATIGDAFDLVTGYAFKSSDFIDQGIPVIKIKNVKAGEFSEHEFSYVADSFLVDRSDKLAQRDDLLISMSGNRHDGSPDTWVGKIAQFRKNGCYLINQRVGALRLKKNTQLDSRFASYLLSSILYQKLFIAIATSSGGQANLSPTQILSTPMQYPRLDSQRAIAHILGTLDDKIELNRKMNETLEAMARALFKSWFVDFDPVRSKAEGRHTGLPKHIADLFPDSFIDSELGEIPKGWNVGKLGDVLNQRVERCDASAETAKRPYVPIDCISPKSLFLTESKPGEEAQSSLSKFYKWDLLFGAMRPYFHKVCIAPFDGTTRSTAFVFNPRQNDDFAFATLLLHSTDTIDFATRHSTGSTIPYAVWSGSLENMQVIVPFPGVRKAFDRIVRPILARIPDSYFLNRYLTELRDTLLPKLISGELRLMDAEKYIGRTLE